MRTEEMAPVSSTLLDDSPQEVTADLRKFNKAQDQVNKALASLSTIKDLTDQAGVDTAMDIMKKAKQVETLIENKRKDLVAPFNAAVKKINDHAKELTAKIPPAIQKGKDAVLAYQKLQEEKALKIRTDDRIAQLVALGFTAGEINYSKDNYDIRVRDIERLDNVDWSDEIRMYERQLEKQKQAKIDALKKDQESAGFFGDDAETDSIQNQIKELETAPATVQKVHVPSFGGGSSKVKGVTKTWTHEVVDLSQVPREYLVLDPALVTKAIRDGVREIPGIKIYQKEGISLR